MSHKFIESDFRRPGFKADGAPLTLSDGQVWHVPAPWIRLVPAFDAEGKAALSGGWTFGPEHDELIDKLFTPADAADTIEAAMLMMVRLLKSQYDLPAEAFPAVLSYDTSDPDNADRWTAIVGHLKGANAGKP